MPRSSTTTLKAKTRPPPPAVAPELTAIFQIVGAWPRDTLKPVKLGFSSSSIVADDPSNHTVI